MSYARWGEDGSSVYVIAVGDASHTDYLTCLQCKLQRAGAGSFTCKTPREMLAHLHEHIARGDTVPPRALIRLEEEAEGETLP